MNRSVLVFAATVMAVTALIAAELPDGWVSEPFDGKSLDGWALKNPAEKAKWAVGVAILPAHNIKTLVAEDLPEGKKGALVNEVSGHRQSVDIFTKAEWADCHLEIEVMVAKGANSGIYMMGEYEIQILDSYGKTKIGAGDMGGIYGASPARVNAAGEAGTWQKYVVDFQAPRFDDAGKKTANARFLRIVLNGKVIHEDVEVKGSTGGSLPGPERPKGPLMFQGDHGPVAYRNIEVTPLKK
jgi:hypothetical protein